MGKFYSSSKVINMQYKQREERLQLVDFIFQHANISIFITKEDGSFYDMNEHAHHSLGYTKEELMGINLQELDTKFNAESWANHWKWLRVNGTANLESKHKRKDGTLMDVDKKIRLIKFNNLELKCAFVTDITEKKKLEVEKEKLLLELSRNNKEITQFNYITTHNLRAPLTNLISICNLINTDKIEDIVVKKLIEGFKVSTDLLKDTLNDLVNILIIKENPNLSKEKLGFQLILDKVMVSVNSKLLMEWVTIDVDFSNAPYIYFNKIYLESILLNLITNAIKYRHLKRYPIIKIKTSKEANGITKLVFSDNGIGMNMERVKNKIFGLYQRFHNNADSKGIGLYLVHSQVTTMGGTIEVDSEVDVGTTFTITFNEL